MQVKFEFVHYDETLNTFEPDENVYTLELNSEQEQTYMLLKDSDLHLYNWFQEADFFINWIKEEIYPNSIGKKLAISVIDEIVFLRFFFFKVTSGDAHYEYFKNLFDIYHEEEWQDREDIGEEILTHLAMKRQELIITLSEDLSEESEGDSK